LIGIGYLAVLPPFEGFDEFAYFSAIRETADTATFPIYGRSFIDRTVEEYEKRGPMRGRRENSRSIVPVR